MRTAWKNANHVQMEPYPKMAQRTFYIVNARKGMGAQTVTSVQSVQRGITKKTWVVGIVLRVLLESMGQVMVRQASRLVLNVTRGNTVQMRGVLDVMIVRVGK
tara:strand:+ start:656 stop:964 length:309 start_codon:yes stop_codon:yes gene_type:complete